MVPWDALKRERSVDQAIPYSESYESDICTVSTGVNLLSAEALLAVETWKRSKRVPMIHGMISANERMSSYDVSHTMNLMLVGA